MATHNDLLLQIEDKELRDKIRRELNDLCQACRSKRRKKIRDGVEKAGFLAVACGVLIKVGKFAYGLYNKKD